MYVYLTKRSALKYCNVIPNPLICKTYFIHKMYLIDCNLVFDSLNTFLHRFSLLGEAQIITFE